MIDFWELDRIAKNKTRLKENLAKLTGATALNVAEIVELLKDELIDVVRAEVARIETVNTIEW